MSAEFGRNLKRLREQKGETQQQVAVAIGTDSGTVSRWERGAADPQLSQIYKLAEHFGVKPGHMLSPPDVAPEGDEPEEFKKFKQTKLGKLAAEQGWLGWLRSIELPVPPTVEIYQDIAHAMLKKAEE